MSNVPPMKNDVPPMKTTLPNNNTQRKPPQCGRRGWGFFTAPPLYKSSSPLQTHQFCGHPPPRRKRSKPWPTLRSVVDRNRVNLRHRGKAVVVSEF